MANLLADIIWRPAFNDHEPQAWVITAAHLTACGLCFLAGRRRGKAAIGGRSRLVWLWYLLAAAMLLLGLNKQLDLQTLLTMWGRHAAQQGGWYAQRRTLQAAFVITAASTGLMSLISGLFILRGNWREFGVACLGVAFLFTFVMMRAASFHHVDTVLYHLPGVGNWMNAGLEFGGALLVGLGALFASPRPRRNIDYLR